MRHAKKDLKMNRSADHKKSLSKNMITQLFLHEKIKTTQRKASFIQAKAEHILSMVQKYDLVAAIRYLKKVLKSELASRKVLELYKDRYKERKSGFTRITKLGCRKGDNAPLVLIELL